jgi:hypothetical protein
MENDQITQLNHSQLQLSTMKELQISEFDNDILE